MKVDVQNAGEPLRQWRQRHRLSQLALADVTLSEMTIEAFFPVDDKRH